MLYSLVPWVGVMAAGYAFGGIMVREPAERRRLCLRVGLSATALFVVAAGLGVLLAPAPPDAPPALFRFLNQQKYPASLLFLLMTLGPAIALLPVAERMRGWLAEVLVTFGRVPMFYYLLHIPLIHATALLVWFLRDGAPRQPLRDGALRLDSRRRAMESGTPLSRIRRGSGDSLCSLPVVRPRQDGQILARAAVHLGEITHDSRCVPPSVQALFTAENAENAEKPSGVLRVLGVSARSAVSSSWTGPLTVHRCCCPKAVRAEATEPARREVGVGSVDVRTTYWPALGVSAVRALAQRQRFGSD